MKSQENLIKEDLRHKPVRFGSEIESFPYKHPFGVYRKGAAAKKACQSTVWVRLGAEPWGLP